MLGMIEQGLMASRRPKQSLYIAEVQQTAAACAHCVYIQLKHSLLLHLGLQPPPQAVVLAHVAGMHAAERVLLELASHNPHTIRVHVPHALQEECYCGIIIRHSIQPVIRHLLLHATGSHSKTQQLSTCSFCLHIAKACQ